MKKIISLFKRDYEGTHLVYDEVVPGAEWVLVGEGVSTRKWDGTSCMVQGGKFYRRYDCRPGRTKPDGFIPCEPQPPADIPHWYGWVPVGDEPFEKWHRAAWGIGGFEDGTYELCGSKVQGNAESFPAHTHVLVAHGDCFYPDCPRTYDQLREWFCGRDIEGIVWHHPDGRMVKIKKRDFGLKRDE